MKSEKNDSPSADFTLVDVPDGPAADWVAVYRERHGRTCYLVDAANGWHPVSQDAAENWVCLRGEGRVYARDGTIFNPADDPIPDSDLERAVVKVARERVAAGLKLGLEDEARLRLAIERTKEAA